MKRRALLVAAAAAGPLHAQQPLVRPRALAFPRDHGAHPDTRTEWWYVTGELQADASLRFGFQLTFFRSRTGLALDNGSRFAARQLLSAHCALTDLSAGRLLHAERLARWNGDAAAPAAAAAPDDTAVHIGDWRVARAADGRYRAALGDRQAGFGYELTLAPTQPLLLQGDAGYSRKGPRPGQASHYYSIPQLAVDGVLWRGAGSTQGTPVRGRAWLDHEWSEELLDAQAVGWDWMGVNLDDGGALTVFRVRRADGSTLFAGGSHRGADGRLRSFAADEVELLPGRRWTSPRTGAHYPVEWTLRTPAGEHRLRALLDAQELDSRASTGAVYWEGLSELSDARGARAGVGYLEMTGVVSPLRLG